MPYLTPDDIREGRLGQPIVDADISDEDLEDYISEFEEIAEEYRGVAYVTRTVTDEQHRLGGRESSIVLGHVMVQSITAVSVEGHALDPVRWELIGTAGILQFTRYPPAGTLSVSYPHGFTTDPPRRLLRACKIYVASAAKSDGSATPRDVIGQSMADGSYTRFSTPDPAAKRPTGWVEVDRLLNMLTDYRAPKVA